MTHAATFAGNIYLTYNNLMSTSLYTLGIDTTDKYLYLILNDLTPPRSTTSSHGQAPPVAHGARRETWALHASGSLLALFFVAGLAYMVAFLFSTRSRQGWRHWRGLTGNRQQG